MIVNENYKNIYNGEEQTYDITSSTSGLLGAHHVLWIHETHDSIHIKVHIFWEGHKILQDLHLTFVLCSASQK